MTTRAETKSVETRARSCAARRDGELCLTELPARLSLRARVRPCTPRRESPGGDFSETSLSVDVSTGLTGVCTRGSRASRPRVRVHENLRPAWDERRNGTGTIGRVLVVERSDSSILPRTACDALPAPVYRSAHCARLTALAGLTPVRACVRRVWRENGKGKGRGARARARVRCVYNRDDLRAGEITR